MDPRLRRQFSQICTFLGIQDRAAWDRLSAGALVALVVMRAAEVTGLLWGLDRVYVAVQATARAGWDGALLIHDWLVLAFLAWAITRLAIASFTCGALIVRLWRLVR